jgi:uncharacterized protein (TIGR03437 family)
MTLSRWTTLLAFFCSTTAALAAPTLRLNGADLRPVWIQQGTNGPTNVAFDAYNIGDGTLNPQLRSSHTWLTPALEAARPCSFDSGRSCRTVRVLFNSSSLAAGTYSGVITILDANALDAPQSVRVAVYVGSNVPSRLDFYLPPDAGASDSTTFQTPAGPPPTLRGSTQTGGNWLAVSSSGMGSFQFVYTHTVRATVQAGMAAADFNGSVAVSNSAVAADNKFVTTVLHVTAQPIARPGPSQLQLQGIQGGPAVEPNIAVANGGRGTLTVSGAATAGGAWLTATVEGSVVKVKADPASLSPGFYNGAVTITTNAANSTVTAPVELEVQARSAPLSDFAGVVDAASFTAPVAGGALTSLFGSQLATGVEQAQSIPLPTSLANTTVFVNNVPVPLIFVSPRQINFQMPFNVSGTVELRVEREGQRGNTITVRTSRRAAGLYGFSGTSYGIVVNASRGDGAVVFAWPNIPQFAGIPKAAARTGDFLVFYGSGLGPVNPTVITGEAAGSSPPSTVTETPRVNFGRNFFGPYATPLFVGLTPGFVGLFQVNVQVPANVPANLRSPLRLEWPDGSFSNTVEIAVER